MATRTTHPIAKKCDILIIGAGVIGSALSDALSQDTNLSIIVIDIDLDGTYSSSALNAGGIRSNWDNYENVDLCRKSLAYFQKVAADVEFKQNGYLWLYGQKDKEDALKRIETQKAWGLQQQWLSPAKIREHYPVFDKENNDIAGATFCPEDGFLNPHALRQHYRNKAKKQGVSFIDRIWVSGFELSGGEKITAVNAIKIKTPIEKHTLAKILSASKDDVHPSNIEGEEITYKPNIIINTAGAWATSLARLYKDIIPVRPAWKQICLISQKNADIQNYGMLVSPKGVYFHHEAGGFLAGYSGVDAPSNQKDFTTDYITFFEEHIWPELYTLSHSFEALECITGWTGLYEMTPDTSGIVGHVSPFSNVFQASGFSGHGVMQSHAVGQGLASLIKTGKWGEYESLKALDVRRFSTHDQSEETYLYEKALHL